MASRPRHPRRGFSLLELLLAIVIMGVIAAFAIVLSGSVRNAAKVRETDGRMSEIAAKAKATYRNTQSLPVATGGVVFEPALQDRTVPVGSTALSMEAKYRFDSWGTPFRYYRAADLGAPVILNILGLGVYGKQVAAILVSSGPNGRAEAVINGAGTALVTTAPGDDIVLAIDVSQEAVEIALEELKVLQSKVTALDAQYQGIDNDGDSGSGGGIDESGCINADPVSGAGQCLPTSLADGPNGDPNCGTATLDYIETNRYGCPADIPPAGTPSTATALEVVRNIFSLSDAYRYDPWGNSYQWGCGTGCGTTYLQTDAHYHKFFSTGPGGTATDDIIP